MGNGIVDGSIDLSFQFQVALRILSGLVAWGAKIAFPEKLGNKLIHIYFICFDLIECINEILCNGQTGADRSKSVYHSYFVKWYSDRQLQDNDHDQ